jgi:hypothetical protein
MSFALFVLLFGKKTQKHSRVLKCESVVNCLGVLVYCSETKINIILDV